jgi:hypothetical protein
MNTQITFKNWKGAELTSAKFTFIMHAAKALNKTLQKIRLPLKLLVPLLAISLFSAYSFASTTVLTSTAAQSEQGVLFDVSGGFSAVNNGFAVAPVVSAASMQPVLWSSGGVCQTALTAGNWFYTFTLTINAKAQPNHTYSVTASWDTGSGYSSLGTLIVTSPSTIIAGQTMTFCFNTGQTSIKTPVAIMVTQQ